MPSTKKTILAKDYNIDQNYLIPSSFGLNEKKKFSYFVYPESEFYKNLLIRITSVNNRRPIIVFFNSSIELYEFLNDYCTDE